MLVKQTKAHQFDPENIYKFLVRGLDKVWYGMASLTNSTALF
jgi:hypothetical protein